MSHRFHPYGYQPPPPLFPPHPPRPSNFPLGMHQPLVSYQPRDETTTLTHLFRCTSSSCDHTSFTVVVVKNHTFEDSNGSLQNSPDAVTIRCPSCDTLSIQCCHCATTYKSRYNGNNGTRNNKSIRAHYKKHHAHSSGMDDSSHQVLSSSIADDCFETCDGIEVGINSGTTAAENKEDEEDEEDRQFLWLPSGEEVAVSDFLGEEVGVFDFINQSLSDELATDNIMLDANIRLALQSHICNAFGDNEISKRYFLQDLECFGRSGISSIVSRAIRYQADEKVTSSILLLLKIMLSLTVKERISLTRYLAGLVNMIRPIIKVGCALPIIPSSPTAVRRILIGSPGTAVYQQTPCENIRPIGNHHVYMKIDELIDTEMAFGTPLGLIRGDVKRRDRAGVFKTPAFDDLLDKLKYKVRLNGGDPEKTLYGVIVLWSDGFVTSWVKQQDNSCWMVTLTICSPDGVKTTNTYIIALGFSKYDHTCVVSSIMEEVELLENGKMRLYNEGGVSRIVHTSFGVITVAGDKPERASVCFCLGHNGLTSGRSQFAALFDPDIVPSCKKCYQKMINKLLGRGGFDNDTSECPHCCGWSYSSDRVAWRIAWPITDKYPDKPIDPTLMEQTNVVWPEGRQVPFGSYVKPMKQTFPWMVAGVRVAILALATCVWGIGKTEQYLATFAVNERIVVNVKAYAQKLKEEMKVINDNQEQTLFLKRMLMIGSLVEFEVIPQLWNTSAIELKAFIELAMHQLYLGTVKVVFETLDEFIKQNQDSEAFIKLINPYLVEMRDFRLSWFQIREIPKSKWISDQYIAWAHCMTYCYSMYFENSEGNAAAKASAMRMVHSMDVMISMLMRADYDIDVAHAETIIKVFLCSCIEFSEHLFKRNPKTSKRNTNKRKKENPFWVKGNFLSLLNLPSQIAYYGSLLRYWDGILERGIQTIKSDLTFLRKRVSFLIVKLRGVRLRQNFDHIFTTWFQNVTTTIERDWYTGFKCYDSLGGVKSLFKDGGAPITFFCLGETICVALGKGEKGIKYVKVEVELASFQDCLGHTFFTFVVDESILEIDRESADSRLSDYGILLPLIKSGYKNKFTAMTNSRRSFDRYGNLDEKRIRGDLFEDLFPPLGVDLSYLKGRRVAVAFRFQEKTNNGRVLSEGIGWYDGMIFQVSETNSFTIFWDGGDAQELSNFEPDPLKYGLNDEGGWILVA